jgi:adenine phosphoribosyltransferase
MFNLKELIKNVPDFPKPGIMFRDINPLLSNPNALSWTIGQLNVRIPRGTEVDAIAGLEARGFYFGILLAQLLGVSFVPLRKSGKLPGACTKAPYNLEYGNDALEVQEGAFDFNEKIVLVDDVLATGGTMKAATELVEKQGATVAACLFLMELTDLNGRKALQKYPVQSLIAY